MPKGTPPIIQRSFPRAPYYWSGTGNGGGGLPQRRVTRLITPPVDPTTGLISGSFTLPKTAGAWLLTVQAAQYCWFRLYADGVDQTADLSRDIDTLPPPTPCILDCVLQKSTLANALDRGRWGPGPGCDGSGNFGYAVDGDLSTWWSSSTYLVTGMPTPDPMVVGTCFSVDFGELITFEELSFGADANGGFKPPDTFSIEISSNGSDWTMLESAYPSNGSATINVALSAQATARYLRMKAVTIPAGPSEWAIMEFNLYLSADSGLRLRLSNGDEFGIPAFNWEDSAQPELFYTLKADPDTIYLLYGEVFQSLPCQVRSWSHSGPGGAWVPGPYDDPNYGDCYLTGQLPVWGGAEYVDPGGIFPRFYVNANELRCGVQNGGIAIFGELPSDMTVAVGAFEVHRSPLIDTTTFQAGMCYFVYSGGEGFQSRPYLFAGIQRSGSTAVHATIYWVDDALTVHGLNDSTDITCGLDGLLDVTTEIVVSGGVTTCNVSVGGTLAATATVPTDLTSLPAHDAIGWDMQAADPPSAPDAWGGLAVRSIAIGGGSGSAQLDLGYVPYEAPGGTLLRPTAAA